MEIIAIVNQKGGVGKTTTALALGQGLRREGLKILFVDFDPQCNLSYSLDIPFQEQNALNMLKNPGGIKGQTQKSQGVDVIASCPDMRLADTVFIKTGKEFRLKECLANVANDYDFCIIDTPPAIGVLVINALTACNGIIIPSQADIYSVQGVGQMTSAFEAVKKYCNPGLKIMGILLTRFNKRIIIRKEIADMLENAAQKIGTHLYRTRIRECTAIVESQTLKKSIFDYAPNSNAARDYRDFLAEFLKKE